MDLSPVLEDVDLHRSKHRGQQSSDGQARAARWRGFYLRSILPSFCTPDNASHSRARVESTAMFRTTEPGVGILTVSARSVAGSNATIWSLPDSSYQMRPSVPAAMPYGWLPSPPGEVNSRTCPVAGSSRPSRAVKFAVYQTPPSGATTMPCGPEAGVGVA